MKKLFKNTKHFNSYQTIKKNLKENKDFKDFNKLVEMKNSNSKNLQLKNLFYFTVCEYEKEINKLNKLLRESEKREKIAISKASDTEKDSINFENEVIGLKDKVLDLSLENCHLENNMKEYALS
jgi:hypothetical protein